MTTTTQSPSQSAAPWWAVLIQGIALVIIGILLLLNPLSTTVFLIQFLGIWWFISGIFQIIGIFLDKTAWGWKLFAGVLGIIAGLLILNHPLWSTLLVPTTLVLVLGTLGLVIGIVSLIQAFQGGGWGVGILGVVSIILGLVLILNPFVAALTLPWVAGVLGLVGGVASIVYAFRIK